MRGGNETPLDWLALELRNLATLLAELNTLGQWKPTIDVSSEVAPLYAASHAWEPWRALLGQSMEAAERAGDARARKRFTLNSGIVAASTGDPAGAEERYREVQRQAEKDADLGNQARALAQRTTLRKMAGEPAQALVLTQKARELYRQAGDVQGEARALGDFANQLDDLDRREEAIVAHTQASELFERLGDRYGQAVELGNLAMTHRRGGAFEAAAQEFGAAASVFTELGAGQLGGHGRTPRRGPARRRNAQEALAVLDRALPRAQALKDQEDVVSLLMLRARAHDQLGHAEALAESRAACDMLAASGDEWGCAVQRARTALLENGPGAEEQIALLEEALPVRSRIPRARGQGRLRLQTPWPPRPTPQNSARARATSPMKPRSCARCPAPRYRAGSGQHDTSAGFKAEAKRARSELSGLPVPADVLNELDDFLACEVQVAGTTEPEMAARVRTPVAQALSAMDWADREVDVTLLTAKELNGTLGRVNKDEIAIQREALGDPGPGEPVLSFLIFGLVAEHVAMRRGVPADNGPGTLILDLIGEWFPRVDTGRRIRPSSHTSDRRPPTPAAAPD